MSLRVWLGPDMDGFGLGLPDFVLSRGGVATKKGEHVCCKKGG